jgi:hypothetical protein
MLDVFNTFNQTKADIKFFYQDAVWAKPRGASFIYMMLIGGGGDGTAGVGGGSGAVTVWMGSALNVPDNLVISVSTGSSDNTTVSYRGTSLTTLLTANASSGTGAATASTATAFASSGFFASTAGQAGSSGAISASTTTFLSAGSGTSVTANYGYSATTASGSFFLTQPIIVGCATSTGGKRGNIGCGGASGAGRGGPGLVIIASW